MRAGGLYGKKPPPPLPLLNWIRLHDSHTKSSTIFRKMFVFSSRGRVVREMAWNQRSQARFRAASIRESSKNEAFCASTSIFAVRVVLFFLQLSKRWYVLDIKTQICCKGCLVFCKALQNVLRFTQRAPDSNYSCAFVLRSLQNMWRFAHSKRDLWKGLLSIFANV